MECTARVGLRVRQNRVSAWQNQKKRAKNRFLARRNVFFSLARTLRFDAAARTTDANMVRPACTRPGA